MGCVCSKAIARSMSIRDELSNHGFQSSAVAWEELLSSHGNTDHLFALVCSVNQRPTNFTLPSAASALEAAKCPSENKTEWKDEHRTGSTSFHTVEEYDALLERIRTAENVGNEIRNRWSAGDFEDFERVVRVDSNRQTGWKRKAVAKGLTHLDLPTIEFPDIGRNGPPVDMDGGQIYSADTYVTPKFGSYNRKLDSRMRERDSGENPVFSRELMAAFEDCMQQLQEEEESILRQMDEDLPAEDKKRE